MESFSGASINGARKRQRENENIEEEQEFMPLSKRINNLHLQVPLKENSNGFNSHYQHDQHQHHPHNPGGGDFIDNNGMNGHNHNSAIASTSGISMSFNNSNGHEQNNNNNTPNLYFHQNGNSVHFSNHVNNGMLPDHLLHHNSEKDKKEENDPHKSLEEKASSYSPSLDESANPIYYEENRKLFTLYLERMQRTGQNLHPNFYNI